MSKQRLYASLMALGAMILLYRTLSMMLWEEAFLILLPWVLALLMAEFLLDLGWLFCSIRWYILHQRDKAACALRLASTAIFLHAFRVLVYVMGRTGPWKNFDVRPEHRASYSFDWVWVWFAAILSVLGMAGVVLVWSIIRRNRRKEDT